MMKWLKNKQGRIDPDDLSRKADESLRQTANNQSHVNALTSYLNRRKNVNGFGEDFEYALIPKGGMS